MTEKVEATQTIEIPSSKDSQEETQPLQQAETTIAAAIQTGAAAQAAESAATEATEAANKAKDLLAQIRESIKPELEAINQRLQNLEEMEAEELTTQEEGDGTLAAVSAETVTLEEPQKQKEETPMRQSEPQEKPQRGGGFLRKILLNM